MADDECHSHCPLLQRHLYYYSQDHSMNRDAPKPRQRAKPGNVETRNAEHPNQVQCRFEYFEFWKTITTRRDCDYTTRRFGQTTTLNDEKRTKCMQNAHTRQLEGWGQSEEKGLYRGEKEGKATTITTFEHSGKSWLLPARWRTNEKRTFNKKGDR